MDKSITTSENAEREFVRIFQRLLRHYSSWSVWQDFVTLSAAAIANAVDKRPGIWHRRENEYLSVIRKYRKDEQDAFVQLFSMTVMALELNREQDFLGKLFMRFGLSNHWTGQFFTPWSMSDLMAQIVIGNNLKERIEAQGYISVNDSAIGAGCTMLAFANACLRQNVNYQQKVLFIGQDVDLLAAKMAYIQLSLLGCAGYVIVGDTIREPAGGTLLNPAYKPPENLWFTPMYYTQIWAGRRAFDAAPRPSEGQGEQDHIKALSVRTLMEGEKK